MRKTIHVPIRTIAVATAVAVAAIGVVAVPAASAQSGTADVPEVSVLAGELANQDIQWESADNCEYGLDRLNQAYRPDNLQCATITVPKDWHNPDNGETWDIRISYAHNVDTNDPNYKGTIWSNPGGPGGRGLVYAAATQARTPDLAESYNYVGFDPRGVGESDGGGLCSYTYVDVNMWGAERAKAEMCRDNADVRTITTEQTTYDMDFMRYLLDVPKLSYIGYSYGTWLGSWYSRIFGGKYGDKFLLDSAVDVTTNSLQITWDLQPYARDRQVDMRLAHWIVRNEETYQMGSDATVIKQNIVDAVSNSGDLGFLVWIASLASNSTSSNAYYPLVPAAYKFITESDAFRDFNYTGPGDIRGLMASFKTTIDSRFHAQVDEMTEDIVGQLGGNGPGDGRIYLGTFDTIRCNDGPWEKDPDFWYEQFVKSFEQNPYSALLILPLQPMCSWWTAPTEMPPFDASTYPDTIVVQPELDSQTAWEGGNKTGLTLPNTTFIAIDNEGSHGAFPYGVDAVDRPIIDFFLSGERPKKDVIVANAKPLPGEQYAYAGWLKIGKDGNHIAGNNAGVWDRAPGFITVKQTPIVPSANETVNLVDPLTSYDLQRTLEEMNLSGTKK